MIKVIPMAFPIHQRHVDEDGGDPKSPMAKAAFAKIDELMKEFPEIKAGLFVLYTPPPENHPDDQPWTTVSTALEGENLTPEMLKRMLDQAIPTLLKMRMMIEDDAEAIFLKKDPN